MPQHIPRDSDEKKNFKLFGVRDDGDAKKSKELHEEAVRLAGRGPSTRQQELVARIGSLLSQWLLEEGPPALKEIYGGDGVAVEKPYSKLTFESLRRHHLGVKRALNTYLIRVFSPTILLDTRGVHLETRKS